MREETIAEEIFTRWSNEMLKARLVAIYSSGSIGAPSQPENAQHGLQTDCAANKQKHKV